MVQDVLLLETRQQELRHIVNRRKRKLHELYRVTCATANALSPRNAPNNHATANKGTYVESEFLEANDIVKGRLFDAATLRHLPGADLLFTPDGSYVGRPQSRAQPPPSPQSTSNNNVRNGTLPRTGEASLASISQPSSLDNPNGIPKRSGPRSPISPVEDHVDTASNVSTTVRPIKGEMSEPAVGTLTRPPATPPAEVTDSEAVAKVEPDPATAAHLALKDEPVKQVLQPANSGPESQLLQEAAQSRTLPSSDHSSPIGIKRPPEITRPKEIEGTPSQIADPEKSQPENGQQARSTPKPPMRIDTSVAKPMPPVLQSSSHAAATPPVSAVGNQSSPPERMRTRVSSGAIRHKSVSEILGETPRMAAHERTPSMDKSVFSPAESAAPSRRFSQATATPDTLTFRRRLSDLRGSQKDLSHQSMVIFARQQGQDDNHAKAVIPKRGALQGVNDYLLPLFLAQASGHSAGLAQLLASSRKTLTTANHHLEARELRDCRILKRIYTLQSTNKWSLRQPARATEPARPATQWDALLAEAKWMRTDFKQERKWKLAQAKNLADACAEWVGATQDIRRQFQIKTREHVRQAVTNGMTPESMLNGSTQDEPVPDLVPSNDDSTSEEAEDDPRLALPAPLPPAAVFSLGPEDLTFALGQTQISEKLLSELPMYDPLQDLQLRAQTNTSRSLDEAWHKPLTLVSRWNDSKIVFPEPTSNKRRKISRYDYAADPEPEEDGQKPLPADQTDVAMFRQENRHIIQRLHASHAFRLPPMSIPSHDFFIHRQPSQWTRSEEDTLRRLVREYAFNWSLISSILSSQSIYSSGAERRTPWECFEKWEMLEGMPTEYARHDYYKRWHLRRQNAKQKHEEQYRQAQEQAQAGQQVQRLRRSGEPQTVERRRHDKHIYVFQSMAKLAKKRESQLQKQQHMAAVAAARKTEPTQNTNRRMRTPAEFSSHKHKQEQEMRQKLMEHRQVTAERARAMNANGRPVAGQAQGMPSIPQLGRGSVPSNGPISQAQALGQAGVNNSQGRLLPPGQNVISGSLPAGARAPGIPQTPSHYQQGQAGTSSNARVLAEASRVSEQQRLMQQTRQYPSMNGATSQNPSLNVSQPDNASFQSLQQATGKLSPAVNVQRPVSSSPRGTQAVPASQNPSNAVSPVINQIKNQIRAMHPNYTDAQINDQATQQLSTLLANQTTHAGANHAYPTTSQQQGHRSQGSGSNIPIMQQNMGMNQQQYAQALRLQMEQQQRTNGQLLAASRTASNGAQAAPRPESRGPVSVPQNRANSATPAAAAAAGASQSPRSATAQVVNK